MLVSLAWFVAVKDWRARPGIPATAQTPKVSRAASSALQNHLILEDRKSLDRLPVRKDLRARF
jgi:hypothetical protein